MNSKRIYVIAEAGSNHDGKFSQAKQLVDVAAESGADAVKFQLFRADVLYPKDHPAHGAVKKCELPREWVKELVEYSKDKNIQFLATPFDEAAIDLLESVQVPAYKWASSETTNHRLLLKVARTRKPVYLSTGMCTIADIAEAIEILEANGCPAVTLLHCYSVYPTSYEDANLNVMKTLRETFGRPVGLSDHSLGITLPIAAAALGADLIEKHFTLSRKLEGPDHSYAIEPQELKEMISHIRNVEKALGSSRKSLHPLEIEYGRRDGVYASRALQKGHKLEESDVVLRRPAKGVQGRFLKLVVGSRLAASVSAGAAINWKDLEPAT